MFGLYACKKRFVFLPLLNILYQVLVKKAIISYLPFIIGKRGVWDKCM